MKKLLFVQGGSEQDKQVGDLIKKLDFAIVESSENLLNEIGLTSSPKTNNFDSILILPQGISTNYEDIMTCLQRYHYILCKNMIGDHDTFCDMIGSYLQKTSINVSGIDIDHIARRTSTLDNYYDIQKRLSNIGSLLGEKDINGRPISIYQFHIPLRTSLGDIPYLELIAPKEGKLYPDAYDHIEFVTKQNLQELLTEYPEVVFQTKGLDKKYNPELEIEFEENLSIKFHNQSIDEVLRHEAMS